MNNSEIYDVLSGINGEYLDRATDLDAMTGDFLKAKKQKRRTVTALCCCAAVLAGVLLSSKTGILKNEGYKVSCGVPDGTAAVGQKYEISPFDMSFDPDFDYYNEYVEITVDDNIRYRQLDRSEYEKFGLPQELTEADFGEYIGTVTGPDLEHWDENADQLMLESPVPGLENAKAYYYAPAGCKAAVIVTNDTNCGIFIAKEVCDATDSYYKHLFEIFGVYEPSDIAEITYRMWDGEYDSTNTAVIKSGKITSPVEIKQLFDILTSGNTMQSDEKITDPCTVAFSAVASNGLIICDSEDMVYYPFKGTGEITGKGILTSDENEQIKCMLGIVHDMAHAHREQDCKH